MFCVFTVFLVFAPSECFKMVHAFKCINRSLESRWFRKPFMTLFTSHLPFHGDSHALLGVNKCTAELFCVILSKHKLILDRQLGVMLLWNLYAATAHFLEHIWVNYTYRGLCGASWIVLHGLTITTELLSLNGSWSRLCNLLLLLTTALAGEMELQLESRQGFLVGFYLLYFNTFRQF